MQPTPDDQPAPGPDMQPAPEPTPAPAPAPAPAPGPDVQPAPGPGQAAPPPDKPPEPDPRTKAEAKKLIHGGDKFLKRGDYYERRQRHDKAVDEFTRALAAYQKAYDLVPNVQIYYAIAGAEARLGRWLDAAVHYRKVLTEGGAELSPELKDAASQKLDDAKQHIGVVTLTVTPDGATVTIDGKEVGKTPLPQSVFLAPGDYTFGFTADGYTPMEHKITVEAGSESERTFALEPIPVVVEKPKPPPPPPPAPPAPDKLPLYIGAGATGAFTVTAMITGIIAVKRHNVFTDPTASAMRREVNRTSGQKYALATDITIVAALASGGFTAYWYLKKYRPQLHGGEHASAGGVDGPKVVVTPMVSPSGGGVAVSGWFW